MERYHLVTLLEYRVITLNGRRRGTEAIIVITAFG